MVKIVGTDEKYVHRKSCRNCAAMLEYTLSEVTRSFTSDWTGSRDEWNYIICPKCSYKVTVK